VGTLTLVKPSEDSFGELLKILSNFALSFLVLLWVWWLYNQTMKDTIMDRRVKYALNFVLLFLVIRAPPKQPPTAAVPGRPAPPGPPPKPVTPPRPAGSCVVPAGRANEPTGV
jgi:hypothetical protein